MRIAPSSVQSLTSTNGAQRPISHRLGPLQGVSYFGVGEMMEIHPLIGIPLFMTTLGFVLGIVGQITGRHVPFFGDIADALLRKINKK